jgi:hypothetical protein
LPGVDRSSVDGRRLKEQTASESGADGILHGKFRKTVPAVLPYTARASARADHDVGVRSSVISPASRSRSSTPSGCFTRTRQPTMSWRGSSRPTRRPSGAASLCPPSEVGCAARSSRPSNTATEWPSSGRSTSTAPTRPAKPRPRPSPDNHSRAIPTETRRWLSSRSSRNLPEGRHHRHSCPGSADRRRRRARPTLRPTPI